MDIGLRITPCKASKLRRLHGVKKSCKIKMRIEKKKEGEGQPPFRALRVVPYKRT